MKKQENHRADFLECDECGEIFVIDEPFCPYCGKPTEEVLKDMEKSQEKRPLTHPFCTSDCCQV